MKIFGFICLFVAGIVLRGVLDSNIRSILAVIANIFQVVALVYIGIELIAIHYKKEFKKQNTKL